MRRRRRSSWESMPVSAVVLAIGLGHHDTFQGSRSGLGIFSGSGPDLVRLRQCGNDSSCSIEVAAKFRAETLPDIQIFIAGEFSLS